MKTITIDLCIYTFDIDFAGHVGNNVYLKWVEMGRCQFLETVGLPIQAAIDLDFVPVLMNTNIAYKKPLYLGDLVTLKMWLSELNKITHTIEFRFYNSEGTLVSTGSQKGIFVNPKTRRPRSTTPELREMFMPYVHSSDDRHQHSENKITEHKLTA